MDSTKIANDAARAIVKGIEEKTGVELDLNLCLDIVDLIGRALAAHNSRLRAALEAVEKWMSGKGDGYALFDLWGAGDIGCFEDMEWDWETTIDSVRDLSVPIKNLSGEDLPDWRIEPVALYRQILAALSPDCLRQAAIGKEKEA